MKLLANGSTARTSALANNVARFATRAGYTIGSATNAVNDYLGKAFTTTYDLQKDSQAFNSAEAAKDRAWQERLDSTKYSRMIADMQKAGINTDLLFANGSAPSAGGTPSGSTARSGSSAGFDGKALLSLLSGVLSSAVGLSSSLSRIEAAKYYRGRKR